jgi:Uma2 family endonuclease
MASVPVQLEALTIEDYMRLYDDEGAFEIIDGEKIFMSPPVMIHVVITKRLMNAFTKYEETVGGYEAFSEAPFVLTDSPNWVKGSRIPDVMVYASERLADYKKQHPDWEEKPIILVPDVAIEIVSATDRYSAVNKKVLKYLEDGVRLIWVLDPHQKTVTVHAAGQAEHHILTEEHKLSGGDVIPNFELPLVQLFAR